MCNKEGELIASLTANALRNCAGHILEGDVQNMNIEEFMKEYAPAATSPPTVSKKHITEANDPEAWVVRDVVQKLATDEHGARECYVVDDNKIPQGILTLTDILVSCRRWRAHPASYQAIVLPLPYGHHLHYTGLHWIGCKTYTFTLDLLVVVGLL